MDLQKSDQSLNQYSEPLLKASDLHTRRSASSDVNAFASDGEGGPGLLGTLVEWVRDCLAVRR